MTDPISLQPKTARSIAGFVGSRSAQSIGLPADLQQDIARRLTVVCLVVLALSIVNTAVVVLAGQSTEGVERYVSLGMLWVASVAVFLLARRGTLSPRMVVTVGLSYEVLVAVATSVANVGMQWFEGGRPFLTWSGVAVWILVFPIMVPGPTRAVLIASIAAALAEPLAVLLFVARGLGPMPDAGVFVRNLWPTAVAVVLAVIVSRMIYQLGQKLERARSMGSYTLEKKLGAGGMGEVWKGTHRMLARAAAVKLIQPKALGRNEQEAAVTLQRFQREAQATASLRSPHTIELFDFGMARDGTFYYVMELLDGVDLQTLVGEYGPQPPERTVSILTQACHSLHEAHARGIIHRDIKPANIFLCRYGVELDFVKVLDFGLVRSAEPDPDDEQLTSAGMVTGTAAFIPPESALGDASKVDGRSDIYSLGCVGYWLLTGRLVFEKSSPMGMVAAHVHETPIPISQKTSIAVPPDLEAVVMACLEKNPDERPQFALELKDRLGQVSVEPAWTVERAVAWWEDHGDATSVAAASTPPGGL